MKNMKILIIGLAAFAFVFWTAPLRALEQSMMQKFMRQKLSYSQNIVEGLALGNQEMVITNAAKLMYMTKSNAWMQVKVSGYLEQTRKFQDDVIVLGNEARARNNSVWPGASRAIEKPKK